MDKEDEILQHVIETKGEVKNLKRALYGQSPTDKGDIGEIKASCSTLRCDIDELKPKVASLETVLKVAAKTAVGAAGAGGITTGILKGFGVF